MMFKTNTHEYKYLKKRISDIVGSQPIQELKESVVNDVLSAAHKVSREYDPRIGKKKQKEGSIEGAITSTIGLILFGVVKSIINSDSPVMENSLAGLTGIIAAAIVHGVQKRIRNWQAHK